MTHESTTDQQQQRQPAPASPVPIGWAQRGVELRTLDDAWRFARAIAASGLAPKGLDKPEAILVVLQMGAEVGLAPMQSLQSIAAPNGRLSIYGDAALALVRVSGLLEHYAQEQVEGGWRVTVKRRGEPPISATFTLVDARRAGLLGKAGPWSQYPDRMCLWRARGFALRDGFGDVLRGMRLAEEVVDIPSQDVHVSPPVYAPEPIASAVPRQSRCRQRRQRDAEPDHDEEPVPDDAQPQAKTEPQQDETRPGPDLEATDAGE